MRIPYIPSRVRSSTIMDVMLDGRVEGPPREVVAEPGPAASCGERTVQASDPSSARHTAWPYVPRM